MAAEVWDWPWPRPESIYDSEGPNEPLEVERSAVRFLVTPTDQGAHHTGRRLMRVECLRCVALVTSATTSPSALIGQHLRYCHAEEL